ncbi:hypothetical protein P7C73_g1980, partial [Tremellales sp. Uapishka_1]
MSAFPQPWTSSVSHWQATNKGLSALWGHGARDPLPTAVVDYVIIGGGMTGSSLAYQLTRPGAAGPNKSVVLLEAKDLCSGATGRNGGHIAPYTFTAFAKFVSPLAAGGLGLTPDQALEVLANETDTLAYAKDLISAEKLDVDFWKGFKYEGTLDRPSHAHTSVIVNQARLQAVRKTATAYLAAWEKSERHKGMKPDWEIIDDEEETKKLSRIPEAVALVKSPTGTVHPHKLGTALVRLALETTDASFQYFSWAPVKNLTPRVEGGWIVDCHERGRITAKEVILCTNAHTKHLFPVEEQKQGIPDHITPYRGHCANITPPPTYSGSRTIQASGDVGDTCYYMTTPTSGLVIGIGGGDSIALGLCTKSDVVDAVDDSVVKDSFKKYYDTWAQNTFEGWGPQAHGEGVARTWTGIMASSRDALPLVGPVPDKPGLYAAVAFHVTRALSKQLLTGTWDTRLPRSYAITTERLTRAKQAPRLLSKFVADAVPRGEEGIQGHLEPSGGELGAVLA